MCSLQSSLLSNCLLYTSDAADDSLRVDLGGRRIIKNYKAQASDIKTLETKYDDDSGDWYVALGWNKKRAIVKMDSVQATITEIKEI